MFGLRGASRLVVAHWKDENEPVVLSLGVVFYNRIKRGGNPSIVSD